MREQIRREKIMSSYDLLMVMPLLAMASCLALVVCIVVILNSASPPRLEGFNTHERRKIQRALAARTPVIQLPTNTSQRAAVVDMRI